MEKLKLEAMLKPILAKLSPRKKRGEYLLDNDGILWYFLKGKDPKLAKSRVMIPEVLSLVHSTFGHSRIARTTLLV